jgi:hypothetical protein
MSPSKISRLFLLAILAGVFPPTSLAAQESWGIRIVPRVGITSPDGYFYEEFANFADDEPVEWTNGSLGRAAFVGAGLEVGRAEGDFLIRGEIARTFDGWLAAVHGIVRPRVFFDPPEIVNTFLDVPATLTFASLQLILPTRVEPWGLRPFVLLGGGGKWYGFGAPTEPNTVEAILPSDGYTASVDLGGGLWFTLFGLDFEAQVKDTINRYWGKTQHDLVFSGGLLWRVR